MAHIIPGLVEGKIERGSPEFGILREHANLERQRIVGASSRGLWGSVKRGAALNRLNARLSFFGWSYNRAGELVEVPLADDGTSAPEVLTRKPSFGSLADLDDQVRHFAGGSGYVVDPITHKRLDKSERYRFGMS